MSATRPARVPDSPPAELAPGEQRLILSGVTWEQYEALGTIFAERSGLRMTYLEGELELMTQSAGHEGTKTTLARLLEIYALERDVTLNGYGSTTFEKRARERGLEPDECYCIGTLKEVPDIAIEIIFSHGGIDKLEVYRGLGVPEVWLWQHEKLTVYQLVGDGYRSAARSRFLPDLDLEQMLSFVRPDDQTAAVRAYRDALRVT
jgi:Uma2 family endonuclease